MHQGFLEHSKPEGFKKPSITHPPKQTKPVTTNNKSTNNNNGSSNSDNNKPRAITIPQQQHVQHSNNSNCLSPVAKQMNGSLNKSASDSRNDEIHRQATLRGLERRSRKLSQKLSESSLNSPYRKNGQIMSVPTNLERESFM